jgi:hypothetical protein
VDKKKKGSFMELRPLSPITTVNPLISTPANSEEMNILTGWMKMRNSMKLWINRWFVLRPGKLIYYSSDKVLIVLLLC